MVYTPILGYEIIGKLMTNHWIWGSLNINTATWQFPTLWGYSKKNPKKNNDHFSIETYDFGDHPHDQQVSMNRDCTFSLRLGVDVTISDHGRVLCVVGYPCHTMRCHGYHDIGTQPGHTTAIIHHGTQGGRHVQSSMIHFDIAEVPAPRQKSIGGHRTKTWADLKHCDRCHLTPQVAPLDAATSKFLEQGLVTVPFWEYWTSPYSSHYRPYT